MTSTPLAPGVTPTYGEPVTEEKLQEIVDRIVERFNPERIILFGSYAYGNPTPDSDVDLLVIMESDKPLVERSAAVSLLLSARAFPMDILAYTPQEIEEQRGKFNPFLREVLMKGRVLYARPDVADDARRSAKDGDFMGDPTEAMRNWIQRAEEDYQTAYVMMHVEGGPVSSVVCFHAQQCVEKYLKALLAQHQVFIPKTHNLSDLYKLSEPAQPDLRLNEADLGWLSERGIVARYPEGGVTVTDAGRALAIMDAVRKRIREAFTLG